MTKAEEMVKKIDEMYDSLRNLSSDYESESIEVIMRTPLASSEFSLSEVSVLIHARFKKPDKYAIQEIFCGGNRLEITYPSNIKITLKKPNLS